MLSIIIPVRNELRGAGYLPKILQRVTQLPRTEVICVDGQSSDGTTELIMQTPGVRLLHGHRESRARRLNTGIRAAKHSLILLHHPRSIIERRGLDYLVNHGDKLLWGGFQHRFDHKHPLLRFTSWYSNQVRARHSNVLYLDHCIFFRRGVLPERNPVPVMDIFEDTALSNRLSEFAPAEILPYYATTSAIRFRRNGIYRQAMMNQALKIGYNARLSHAWMNRVYERGLGLNSQTK